MGPRGVLDRRGLPQPYVLLLLPGGGAGLLAEGRAEGGRPEVRLPLHMDGQDGGGEVEVSEVVADDDDDIAVNSDIEIVSTTKYVPSFFSSLNRRPFNSRYTLQGYTNSELTYDRAGDAWRIRLYDTNDTHLVKDWVMFCSRFSLKN